MFFGQKIDKIGQMQSCKFSLSLFDQVLFQSNVVRSTVESRHNNKTKFVKHILSKVVYTIKSETDLKYRLLFREHYF